GPEVADQWVADHAGDVGQQRVSLDVRGVLQGGVGRHRADRQGVAGLLDPREPQPPEVDEVARRFVPEAQETSQALPAGQRPGFPTQRISHSDGDAGADWAMAISLEARARAPARSRAWANSGPTGGAGGSGVAVPLPISRSTPRNALASFTPPGTRTSTWSEG